MRTNYRSRLSSEALESIYRRISERLEQDGHRSWSRPRPNPGSAPVEPPPVNSLPPTTTPPNTPAPVEPPPVNSLPPVNTTPNTPTPAPGTSLPPTNGGTTPPANGGTTPPANGGTTPPANGGTTPPANGGTTPPSTPSPSSPGDVVGFSLQNASGAAEGTGYVTFGQVFAKGAVMPGTTLVAKINGLDVAVQMDVKTTNPDGSVGHALLTLKAPALATDGSVSGVLAKVAPAPAAAAIQAQDIVNHGLDVKVQVTLHNADGSTTVKTVDAAAVLQQAINAGTVETWMKGAQASEYRVEANIAPNLDVKLDIRMDALGKMHTDVIFARDEAYTTNVSTLNYDVKITQDGATAYNQANIQQYAYSTWHHAVSSSGSIDPHVVYDMQYLINTGAVPAYDLSNPISQSLITGYTQQLAQANTGPMGSALVQKYMPMTGGRDDIGPETTWNARYLTSQNADAAKVMFANADAAGSVPWHLVDTNGDAVRVDLHPNLWIDGRSGGGSDALPVSYNPSASGWNPDTAHAPSLTFVPYLLSGTHYYLDELQTQAAYDIAAMNPGYRGFGEGQFWGGNVQVRHIAWGLRDVANAAFISPDSDAMKAYFSKILSNNLDRLITDFVNGPSGDAQGQLEGWIQGIYGDDLRMAPWQQDYLATVFGEIAARGDAKAATILDWMDGFLAGRFLNAANGFDPLHGTAYNLSTIDPATGHSYTTWAQMYQATFGNAPATVLDDANLTGGYAATAKAALASLISVSQSPDAIEAYGFLQSQNTAMIANYANNPTWNIAPKLANGQYLTNDEIHVHTGTNGTTLTAGSGDTMLIGNAGNDTIVGGSGIGLLFGMDGNDTITAGAGNSYLYGGNGNDRLVDGAGNNYLKGGAGADVFSFNTATTGRDTIDDFTKGADRIEIKGGGFTAANLVSQATADAHGNAVLHLGSHDIVLQGVLLGNVTQDIFNIV
jgi:Ca2+-binding RTX toxin-like protein